MYFKKTISFINGSANSKNIRLRTAVRAIIIEEEKILMVRSDLGYYKLPGGGVEHGASHAEALVREVAEETGYLDCLVEEHLGVITELREDVAKADACFQMESHHYICRLSTKQKAAQALIGYELEEGYTPVWISIQGAIDANRAIYETEGTQLFIPRENFVLKWLQSPNLSMGFE